MADTQHRRSVEDELIWRAGSQMVAMLALIPFSSVAMFLLSGHAPMTQRVAFLVWTFASGSVALALVWRIRRYAQLGLPRSRRLMIASTIALCAQGVTWGSTPVVFLPAPSEFTFSTIIFAVGALTAYVAGATGHPPWFVAMSSGLLLPLTAAIGSGALATHASPAVALVCIPFLAFLIAAEVVSHRTMREAIEGRLLHERLAQDLACANTRLQHQANRDALTGLANRARFHECLEDALREARSTGRTVAVVYLDLDRFKVVNDSLGHTAGDALLEQVARRLEGGVRGGDVLARIGGDEFTVLLRSIENGAEAVRIAQRILSTLTTPFELSGTTFVVGASVGVAHAAAEEDTGADLLRHADAALYLAKGNGRNQVVPFDERLRAELSGRLEREVEVRRALAANEFEAWFQPIVDVKTGAIVAAEALARWRHPTRGIVSPAEFLPVLQEAGMLADLSITIGEQAKQFRFRVQGHAPPGFRVYVNVTDNRKPLATAIENHAAGCEGCAMKGLGLEITEDTLIGDIASAREAVARARACGMAVVLDDLGTAYASLALVRELPLDGVKIDRSFISRMMDAPADDAVVSAVAALGRRLGYTVTAEGVETEAQLEHLRALGVTRVQGFLFSPAVEGSVFEAMLSGALPWAVSTQRRGAKPAKRVA